MINLSVIILTKNEETNISDCLKSVEWADEIIVVDDFSEDGTIEILKRVQDKGVNVKYFQRHLDNDFAKQRNFGLEKATRDWILYIDADERLDSKLKEEVVKIISGENDNFSAFILSRKNFYYGNFEWPKTEKLERLFKKEGLKGWDGMLHESPRTNGDVGQLDGYLLHFTHQRLSEMVENTIRWSEIEADLRFKSNHPKMSWWRFLKVMLNEFFRYYVKDQGYKAGTAGLVESIYQSFSIFVTYSKLWEKQRKAGQE